MLTFEQWWVSRFPNEIINTSPLINQAFRDVAKEAWEASYEACEQKRAEDEAGESL